MMDGLECEPGYVEPSSSADLFALIGRCCRASTPALPYPFLLQVGGAAKGRRWA